MSHNTMNNRSGGGSSDSGVFDPLNDSDPRIDSGFAIPGASAGEADLRRLMRSRLNAYFDAEGNRDRVAAREALHDLSGMPGGSDEIAAMRRVLGGFDVRPEHPDLTRVVLAKVAKRGTFLSRPARRRVSAARVLIACSLLVVVGTFVYIDRASTAPVDGPAGAISAVVEAQRSDAAESVRNLARAVDSLRSDLIEPVGALVASDAPHAIAKREPQRSLAMGDTSGYEETASANAPTAHATAMPMTRLMPIIQADLDSKRDGLNLAGSNSASARRSEPHAQPAVARALAAAEDAWSIAPSPSVLLDNAALDASIRAHQANPSDATEEVRALRLDLNLDLGQDLALDAGDFSNNGFSSNDFSNIDSIDNALIRGGLLTKSRPGSDIASEPEIRLRPDGSRTILWWVFPNAADVPK
jgi:hypothetical protein